jgi:hypothetical protein
MSGYLWGSSLTIIDGAGNVSHTYQESVIERHLNDGHYLPGFTEILGIMQLGVGTVSGLACTARGADLGFSARKLNDGVQNLFALPLMMTENVVVPVIFAGLSLLDDGKQYPWERE